MQTSDASRAAEEICRIVNALGVSAIPDTEQATAIIESLVAKLKAENTALHDSLRTLHSECERLKVGASSDANSHLRREVCEHLATIREMRADNERLTAERDSLKELLSLSVKSDLPVLQKLQRRINDLAVENGRLVAERDALQRFKDWVHSYLDSHGVPHHPPGSHGAAGCRIGDRMDWLMAGVRQLEARLEAVRQWTPEREQAVADALERWRNSGGFSCSDLEDDGVVDCMMTLAQAYDDLRPLQEVERVGRPASLETTDGEIGT